MRTSAVLGMGLVNWGIWTFMVALIGSQFLGIFWSSSKTISKGGLGNDPSLPPAPLGGFNDEPYADRAIVCLTQGRTFVPTQLTAVLADPKLASVVETNGTSINGFRVVERAKKMTLQPQMADFYNHVCDRIDFTLRAIQDSCEAVGYDVTRDALRIIDGVYSNTTYEITRALPVLMVPFMDNGASMAYVIPASDGSACIFRLQGAYQSAANTYALFRAVPKAVRLSKTVQYLGKPGGVWRNGWYEALNGQRWYSNMISSSDGGSYGIEVRQFDTLADEEVDCRSTRSFAGCQNVVLVEHWGRQISTASELSSYDQIFATNGSRFGLFRFESTTTTTVTNVYSLETFVSNTSVFIILIRWFVSLGAMLYSRFCGVSGWQTTGIGALSSSRTFNLLPVVLLPKLKLTLAAFFTVGCSFEGQQMAFSNAWYIIYPGIVEFMVYYYSLLNIIGKITYRRVSDVLFGPTLLALCALHYYRVKIAMWPVLRLNGRLSTLILSDEVDALTLADFVTTDVAMRLNGNAHVIFYTKIALLVINLLPLLFSRNMTETHGREFNAFSVCAIEKILALRASNLGGLGQSPVYMRGAMTPEKTKRTPSLRSPSLTTLKSSLRSPILRSRVKIQPSKTSIVSPTLQQITTGPSTASSMDQVLIGYEMSRIGYLVFGGQFLLSFDDWYILTSLAPLRVIEKLWNYRIIVFEVARDDDGSYRILGHPQLCRLDNPRLRVIPFYQITVCDFQ